MFGSTPSCSHSFYRTPLGSTPCSPSIQVTSTSPYYNVSWLSSHTKGPDLQAMHPFQRINHFARSSELTRKDRLSQNVQRMQETKGARHFNILPKTFLLPEEYARFSACHLREHGVWIVKPVASSRGRGIYIINNVSVRVYVLCGQLFDAGHVD